MKTAKISWWRTGSAIDQITQLWVLVQIIQELLGWLVVANLGDLEGKRAVAPVGTPWTRCTTQGIARILDRLL